MNTNRSRFALLAIPLVAVAAMTVAADRPRADGGVIDPTCSSSLACIEYDNNSNGPGVKGHSLKGNGLAGFTFLNSTSASGAKNGVYGQDESTAGSFNSGVGGKSVLGTGVSGVSSRGVGVSGTSTGSFGVYGTSADTAGVDGNGFYGIYGVGTSYGVVGTSSTGYGSFLSGSLVGAYGSSTSGSAVYGSSSTGYGLQVHTGGHVGAYVTNSNGNGGDIAGSYIGVVGRAPTTGFPLIATDNSGNNLFWVDGSGNVNYHGGLFHFAATRTGKTAVTYGATTAVPSVEDTGSGQLVNGVAMVSLDPAFAQTIDPRAIYHVMLTPDGDTRGLYVASKGPSGFVVREVQGGRGSLAFDYHIYATALGHAGERMTVMSDAQTRAMAPKAPLVSARPLPAAQPPVPLRPPAQATH